MAKFFDHAHDFSINNLNLNLNGYPSENSLNKLEARISAGAIHDSAERCDAPKCHEHTRIAVQDDLYSRISEGDRDPELSGKIVWVTGPAGTGKTAVMGSLAERCSKDGVLLATFFFASWSWSSNRRRKTAFVATIAHQLAHSRQDLKKAISDAIDKSPTIFEKNIHVQMEALVLAPLRELSLQADVRQLQGAIIVDGVDECQAEQYHDTTSGRVPARENDQDQLEILQVLQTAASDPSFPFRIFIASRPERVFREFFDPDGTPDSFVHKIDLHEHYNADADITLFLQAHFNRIRRRYNLPASWPPRGAIPTLVRNASGQFVYADTVIRFLELSRLERPEVLLEAILKMRVTTNSNPFEPLDLLYSHILASSPDPPLSIMWIRCIGLLNGGSRSTSAMVSEINLLLKTDPESSEAEHLLGNLHSLIRTSARGYSEVKTMYHIYHKSLLDFLSDQDRSGDLHITLDTLTDFIWDRFIRACTRCCDPQFSYSDNFRKLLTFIPREVDSEGVIRSRAMAPPAASVDWWVIINVNPSVGPLEKLESQIAAGAIHDSAERCDAPKCHPETRIAVQEDLYDWIVHGDRGSEHPSKIKWVTGPAGTGKTAVMGSLAERCAAGGLLAATFFFASWSTSAGRRRKTAFVTTIAYQLAQHREDLNNAISDAIERSPGIFDKKLQIQMEVLVLAPLREITGTPDRPDLRGVILIDGLDECEAEQYHDASSAATKGARENAHDQLEILQVLRTASLDPSFPFRIVVASRPERVFREFFDPENNSKAFSPKLDLHEDYNAEADIALFLKAHLNRIRRRYNLSSSWPLPQTIQTLVENASGQFIYAATVIRFLDESPRAPPDSQLKSILEMRTTPTSNPLEQLDALYSHVLKSSPNPILSVYWIRAINMLSRWASFISCRQAAHVNLLLQTENGEAEHLLGALHSLVRIPPPNDQTKSQYSFYHKSLLDFLNDDNRCGDLFLEESDIGVLLWDRFIRTCTSEFGSASATSLGPLTP
ncbi:hypothetical protein MD484_g2876, partial [Candolleomyces efflorescens]